MFSRAVYWRTREDGPLSKIKQSRCRYRPLVCEPSAPSPGTSVPEEEQRSQALQDRALDAVLPPIPRSPASQDRILPGRGGLCLRAKWGGGGACQKEAPSSRSSKCGSASGALARAGSGQGRTLSSALLLCSDA